MRRNKTENGGFSLVELLAVIVILGILSVAAVVGTSKIIERARNENIKALESTLEMAAKSYTEKNFEALPTKLGEMKVLSATVIKDAKFLENDLINYDKKSCTNFSFVKIYKRNKTNYEFVPYIYCNAPEEGILSVPSVRLSSEEENVFRFLFNGNESNLVSYSYAILASSNGLDNYLEIYRSEWIPIEEKVTTLEKSIDISKYGNRLGTMAFKVLVEICNGDGKCSSDLFDSSSGSSAIIPTPEQPTTTYFCGSFAEDSWETIISNVQAKNTDCYEVGDTKEVDLGALGTHILRIANMSTPSECFQEGYSQTACGFVLEFVDIITKHNMNSTNTNVGGWPATEMRTYVNSAIYNALPSTIKNAIIDTTVISGHGYTGDTNNFTSTDKIYPLSHVEVYGSNDNYYDTLTTSETRQLDYYQGQGVTGNNNPVVRKQYNGTGTAWWSNEWWLRSAIASGANMFGGIDFSGAYNHYIATSTAGVAPAFRLGG